MTEEDTLVTRERVMAPPDRYLNVSDGELVSYFQSAFDKNDSGKIVKLHEMLDGICSTSFCQMKRVLEQDFSFFAAAAAGDSSRDPRAKDPTASSQSLDAQEVRFVSDLWDVLEASHYRLLTSSEWEAAQAEDFLLTLPVSVKWDFFDENLLKKIEGRQNDLANSPKELRDRVLVFHRGVDVARIKGKYFMEKIDLIISFFILQPVFRVLCSLLSKLGLTRWLPEAPNYVCPSETGSTSNLEESIDKRHAASINIERRTFAREYRDGVTTLKHFFKDAELQEACFKDVIVVYRAAVADGASKPGEFDIISNASEDFMRRNIILKRFSSIPIADLELVFPDRKIFLPPQVIVNIAVTLIGALVALVSALKGGIDAKVVWTTLTMLGTRLAQLYTTAMTKKTYMERAMQKIIFDRTVASQETVLISLREEMARQLTRETFLAFCILATSSSPLYLEELDKRCEDFLVRQFGLKIDFTAQNAVEKLLRWGLFRPILGSSSSTNQPSKSDASPPQTDKVEYSQFLATGRLEALPLTEALKKLDEVWDGLNDFCEDSSLVSTMTGLMSSKTEAMKQLKSLTSKKASSVDAPSDKKNSTATSKQKRKKSSEGGLFGLFKK